MSGFVLSGPDLEVRYRAQDDTLTVQGDGLPLGDGPFTFQGAEITRSESADGTTLGVVLLESSRNCTQVRLSLLVPQVDTSSSGGQSITGAAIIVSDFREVMGGPPPVHHKYDVRPMTGTVPAG